MIDKEEVHISDLRTFKSCRRKWNWSSLLREGLEPMKVYAPFFTGRCVHYALEKYYEQPHDNRETPPVDFAEYWIDEELQVILADGSLTTKDQLEDQFVLIEGMMEHYALWVDTEGHAGPYSDGLFDIISMETEFNVPIVHPETGEIHPTAQFAGRFDGIIRMKATGEHWIFETKTARSIKELLRSLVNDEQASGYLYAAETLLRIPIAGILYNVLRKKVPTRPSELSSSKFSTNKRIDTTDMWYYETLQAAGYNHEEIMFEYGPFLLYLNEEKGNTFFQRVPVRRTDAQKKNFLLNFWDVATEMTNESTPHYPSPSMIGCNWCMFREPCLKVDLGRDPQFNLDLNYKRRREWDPLTAKES